MPKYIYVAAGFKGESKEYKTPQIVFNVNGHKFFASQVEGKKYDYTLAVNAESAKKLGIVSNSEWYNKSK